MHAIIAFSAVVFAGGLVCIQAETCADARNKITLPSDKSVDGLRPMIERWAPVVKLAKGESYNPSSVDFFLERVTLNGRTYNARNLPKCDSGCHLQTKEKLSCESCRVSAFDGENPADNNGAKVPTYVIMRKPSENIVDFIFWFFYPYNRGKNVCVGYYLDNVCPCGSYKGNCFCSRVTKCIGGYSTFGHHVGDWEHVIIRFKNDRLYSIYLSIHDSKVTQKFGGEFLWTGSTFRRSDGTTLSMDSCTHPRVYSAAGSHGMWPSSGSKTYQSLGNGDELSDDCSDGTSWETWKNLKIVELRDDDDYSGEFTFLRYAGRWGNDERGCDTIKSVSGECILNEGPTGPQYKGFVKSGDLGKRDLRAFGRFL